MDTLPLNSGLKRAYDKPTGKRTSPLFEMRQQAQEGSKDLSFKNFQSHQDIYSRRVNIET
jgi:hypothetical protein